MTEELTQFTAPLVTIDGELLPDPTINVDTLEVREDADGLRTLRVSLLAHDTQDDRDATNSAGQAIPRPPRFLDGETFDFGSEVSVVLGAMGRSAVVFDGRISAIEVDAEESSEPMVTFFAEDKLMELRLTRRAMNWENKSDADIAREIADRHGMTPDVDAEGPTWESVQQWNMSDLAFLRERARLIQAEVWVSTENDRSTLHFKSRTTREGDDLPLSRDNDLLKIVVRADLAHQRTAVHVRGWDAKLATAIEATASGSLIRDEIDGQGTVKTGPELFETHFGKRSSWRVREVPHDEAQAQDVADAEMRRRARAFVQVTGITRGNPSMNVGTRVELQYLGAPFNGSGYYVTKICHSYDRQRGLRTEFDAERPFIKSGGAA